MHRSTVGSQRLEQRICRDARDGNRYGGRNDSGATATATAATTATKTIAARRHD